MKLFRPSKGTCLCSLLVFVLLSLVGDAVLHAAEVSSEGDAQWRHIKDLQQRLSGNAPKGVNEVEFFAPVKTELHAAATSFAAAHPEDARQWEAKMIEVKTTQFPIPAPERKELFAANEKLVANIKAAADAPPEIKQNAERTILFQHLDHLDLVSSPQEAVALENRLLDYLRAYPDDPKASSMQVRRADLLAKSDASKVRPLLDELAGSSNPKVAAAARGRLEQLALANRPLDWKFTALDGREVDFAQLRGRVILVDYWASWCPDCLRALPQVLASYRKYREKGLEVLGVSLDNDDEALREVAANIIPLLA